MAGGWWEELGGIYIATCGGAHATMLLGVPKAQTYRLRLLFVLAASTVDVYGIQLTNLKHINSSSRAHARTV